MKIWIPVLRAGSGADVFVLRLAQALRERGHEAVVDWFDHRYEFAPWLLRGIQPPAGTDIVHAGSWQGFALKRPGIPLVVTEHNYIGHPRYVMHAGLRRRIYHGLLIRHFLRSTYAAADALVAVSHTLAAAMREGMPGLRVQVIPNWVDTTSFHPATAPGRAGDPFRLLYVGNPSRWKGTDLVPRIAQGLGDGFRILCMGGLRRSAGIAGAPGNVEFLPRVEPHLMPEVYRTVDAVLVTARYEAFGYVALEAMASGLPVVGFDTTGVVEVCENGRTALLSPVDDVGQLIGNVRAIADAPELRAAMAMAGRRRAVEHYGEGVVEDYIALYRRLCAG